MGAAHDAIGGDGYDRARAHRRLRGKRATYACAQDEENPRRRGTRPCAMLPCDRYGNVRCGPKRKRETTLG
ncbi:hypothetical protein DIE14_33440 [Burkholderia sp. Bp9017]|nr:hypothetical protein DIE14_33440 [Burkholderia sp. Bp9017]RQZ26670.1 hypothetical protein DIE13_30150 [Burkholderia sp. Bp9016]